MKKYILYLLLFAIGVFVASCDDDEKGQIQTLGIQEAKYISGSKVMQLSLKDNATLQITPVYTPGNVENPTFEYRNLHPEFMEVSSTGLLTGKSPGIDTLIVKTTDGSNLEARYQVLVIDHIVKATGITVSASGRNMQIVIDNDFDLKAEVTVNPDDVTDNAVTFISLNPEIATVDANGIVSAKALGNTQIRITTADGSNISTDCNVTVIAEPPLYLEKRMTAQMLSSNLEPKEGSLAELLDDKNNTFWAPKIDKRPIYSPACWLDIDFGGVIKFAKLYYRHRSLNYAHMQVHTFTLQGRKAASDDWIDLGEYITTPKQVDNYQVFSLGEKEDDGVYKEIQYLRINFIKGHLKDGASDWNYEDTGNLSIGDLKVYVYNR